jgi:hypothetical protein
VTPAELPPAWRTRADELARFAPAAAEAFRACAAELAEALERDAETQLTLQSAAQESGYSEDHLATLIRQGRLRNVGRKHAPRIRRGDLPRKPRVLANAPAGAPTLARLTRDAVNAHSRGR